MKFDYCEWKNPPSKYRAKPFWAFNGKLEKKELKRQIKIFKKMGFGGAFFHSRTGLITEYMSKEWLDLVDYCVDEITKNGMEAWLYDEDRYSSGSCGGVVTANMAYREKSMVYDEVLNEDFTLPENFIGLFALKFGKSGKNLISYRKITDVKEKLPDEKVFCFYFIYMEGEEFYNTNAYVDTMNKDATELFIKLTHEKYKAKMGGKFGNKIKGIFTDEPHRGPILYWFTRSEKNRDILVPYTFKLFDEFKARKGYDLKDCLPVIWFGREGEPFTKETYDLIEVLQQLFLENYAKPYHEWCKKNNLIFTGHVLHEDNIVAQVSMSGSIMRFMEYFDYPGMDNLGHTNYTYAVPALVNSVAKQLGKKFVLDELYGITGWQTTFADYKRIGDWQSYGGVSLRVPHHSWYTMKGEAKRDYPASISYQSAWYDEFKYVEDYFSRLQYLFVNGKDCTDVAIINPVESAWGLVDQYSHKGMFETDNPLYKKIQEEYLKLYPALLFKGAETDFIDEGLFEKYGKVEDGLFKCGLKSYKTVILNGNLNLRNSTAQAIKKFIEVGGKVIIAGDMPRYKDGIRYDYGKNFEKAIKLPFDTDAVFELIKSDDVIINAELITVKRNYDDAQMIAFLNPPENDKTQAEIKIKTNKNCVRLNPRTGEKQGVNYTHDGEYIVINHEFENDGEFIILLCDENLPAQNLNYEYVDVINEFNYSLSENNLLPLDYPKCFVDGKFFCEDYILNVDEKLRLKYNLTLRHNYMVQPWYKEKFFNNQNKVYGKITLNFEFIMEYIPPKVLFYIEDAEKVNINLNGNPVKKRLKPVELDNSLNAVMLPDKLLKTGKNQLSLTFDFYEKTNLETCYLAGNFGVENEVVKPLKDRLFAGDFTSQGLEFYGGKIIFKKKIKNGDYLVKADKFDCALIKINGKVIAYPPFFERITVSDGKINGEIVLTRINTFGTFIENGKRQNVIPQGVSPIKIYRIKNQ